MGKVRMNTAFSKLGLFGALVLSTMFALADAPPLVLRAALAEADYPPFYYVDNNGTLTGVSVEVLHSIAQSANVRIEYHRHSWPRVLKSLETGDVDMVTTFFNTAERAPHVVYTGVPHTYESSQLFVLADSALEFQGDLQGLEGLTVGVIRGYSYGLAFDSSVLLKKEPVLDEPTLVRMLLSRRFELAIGNPFAIQLAASRLLAEKRLRFLQPEVDRSPIYMAFSRKHPQALPLAERFTGLIYELKQTSAYQQMHSKYGL